MKALEIFQIAIKKGVLVVPFDFASDPKSLAMLSFDQSNVIHFVRNRFAWLIVDGFLYRECFLEPVLVRKIVSQALRTFGFTAAGSNYFLDRHGLSRDYLLKLGGRIREINLKYRKRVRDEFYLVAFIN